MDASRYPKTLTPQEFIENLDNLYLDPGNPWDLRAVERIRPKALLASSKRDREAFAYWREHNPLLLFYAYKAFGAKMVERSPIDGFGKVPLFLYVLELLPEELQDIINISNMLTFD